MWREGEPFCDGCGGAVPAAEAVFFYPRGADEERHYHQSCRATGWYTGILAKEGFPEPEVTEAEGEPDADPVAHPAHYNWLPKGIEVIDITEALNFCLGNAIKYILRADHKGKPVEDMRKAVWYLEREIANRESRDVV